MNLQSLSGASPISASSSSLPALSTALSEGTKDHHTRVSAHTFLQHVLNNTVEKRIYHQYLVDLRSIYIALEEEMLVNLNVCPELKKINFPELNRQQALTEDLNSASFNHLPIRKSQAALNYAEHLRQLGRNNPILLVAHAYVHYMGELSGGLIMKRHIEKKWPDAIHLYDFSNLFKVSERSSATAFKELYRERLNSLAINKQIQEQIVKEACLAFEYSEKMFNAILSSKASTVSKVSTVSKAKL